jgi:ATP-dependent exoDNAse (exonuclease V) beta subunit
LVRARPHLEPLLPALRAAGIPVAAVELDALGERVAVQDLVSLTHALVQPADRLAWLAVLRAPWCGLLLPDLFAIVAAAEWGVTARSPA